MADNDRTGDDNNVDIDLSTLSDMESDPPPTVSRPASLSIQGLTNMLTALHVYDRPIDFGALNRVLAEAVQYLNAVMSSGIARNELLEANFLRPLLRETIPSVFNRLFIPDPQHLTDTELSAANIACLYLSCVCAQYLTLCWRQSNGFQPCLSAEARRDLSGIFNVLSFFLFNSSARLTQILPARLSGTYFADFSYATPFMNNPSLALLTKLHADGHQPHEIAAVMDRVQENLHVAPMYFASVNYINWFGRNNGFNVLIEALKVPDRCGIGGILMLTSALMHASPQLLDDRKQECIPCVLAVVEYLEAGFSAANELTAFEENPEDSGQSASNIIAGILQHCSEICFSILPAQLLAVLVSRVIALEKQLVLRLLHSGHFTRQLAAVKELAMLHTRVLRVERSLSVLRATVAATTEAQVAEANAAVAAPDAVDAQTEQQATPATVPSVADACDKFDNDIYGSTLDAFISWIKSEQIIEKILRTNLHQSQYAEAAQRILVQVARHDAITSDHIAFLWHLIEDAATFEDIKRNVCAILGAVTPYLAAETQAQVLSRAAAMAMASSSAALALSLRLLESISRNDKDANMPREVLNTLCSIIIRTEAVYEVATSTALVDACLQYMDSSQPGGEMDWARMVTRKCMDALQSGDGAVPAAQQLSYMMLKVVPLYYPKPGEASAFYSEINADNALFNLYLAAYTRFLDTQRTATSTSPPNPPSIGAFQHYQAANIILTSFFQAIANSCMLVELEHLKTMLKWATEGAVTDRDSRIVWKLLQNLVSPRHKHISKEAVAEFVSDSLCSVQPQFVSWKAWCCVTAYMAVMVDWELDLAFADDSLNSGDCSRFVTTIPTEMDWQRWRQFLKETALAGPAKPALQASRLLAYLVAFIARTVMSPEEHKVLLLDELESWQAELKTAVHTLCGRLPTSWYDAPPLAANLEPETARQAAHTAQRALFHLQWLIDEGQARSLPSRFAHAASYEDNDLFLDFTFNMPAAQGQASITATKASVALPRNTYVGVLRSQAAKKLSRLVGQSVPPSYVRLFSGGKELNDDGRLLSKVLVISPVMVSICAQPNSAWHVYGEAREALDDASPAVILSSSGSTLHSLALAMEQIQLPPECDADGSIGNGLRNAASDILGILPTCSAAVHDVERLLTAEEGSQYMASASTMSETTASASEALRNLYCGTGADATAQPKHAVVRYVVETLCSLVLPVNRTTEGTVEDAEMSESEIKSLLLKARLFPSGALPALLDLLTAVPTLGGAYGAPKIHGPLLLLASSVCNEMRRSKNVLDVAGADAEEPQQENQQDDPAAVQATAAVARYILAMMTAAVGRNGGHHEEPFTPSDTSSTPALHLSSVGITLQRQVAVKQAAEDLCNRGLVLLRCCIDAVPELATMLVEQEQEREILGSLLLVLLNHSNSDLRDDARSWVDALSQAAPAARHWVFEVIITPLLLATDANNEQTSLISNFMSNLEDTEAEVARGVLDELINRLLHIAKTGDGPLRGTADSVLLLVRRLDCHEIGESKGLVLSLLSQCLLPEMISLSSSDASKGGLTPEELFTAHPLVLRAARRSAECREVCYDLLKEFVVNDRASWDLFAGKMPGLIESSAKCLPRHFGNEPLPSLRGPDQLCGLRNGGATCYMNATFQQLFMQPTVQRLLVSAPTVPEEEQTDSVFHQVQTMFAHLAAGIAPWYEPRGFWSAFKDYDGHPVNIREHQDAYEFFTRLQDSVDEHLRSIGHPRAIYAALGGTFAQVITVAGRPELRSQRDEEFYQISLDVRGKRSLQDSLDSYVAVELMNGENQWLCEELGKKVDAEKRTLIGNLPNTLMLHLKRFEWDYESFTRWKVKDRFDFPMQLNMKPYTVEGTAAAGSASASDGCSLHPDAYYEYELRGIVVHSGTAFAGHYYSYIKDRTSGQWYCFDDTSVEPWDPVSLEEECFGGKYRPEGAHQEYDRPNSAYMLVYERIKAVEEAEEGGAVGNRVGAEAMLVSPVAAVEAVQGPGADKGLNMWQQEAIARSNMQAIAIYHLLDPLLVSFVAFISQELRIAVSGGKSRKAPRIGLNSPGFTGLSGHAGAGLMRITSNRDEDSMHVLGVAADICVKYLLQVAARAHSSLLGAPTQRKGTTLIGNLTQAARSSVDVAFGVIDNCSNEIHFSRALRGGPGNIQEASRRIVCVAAEMLMSAYGETYAVDTMRSIYDSLMEQIKQLDKHYSPSALVDAAYRYEETLGFLEEIASQHEAFAVLAQPHLETLISIGYNIADAFTKVDEKAVNDPEFGRYYLSLLATAAVQYDHRMSYFDSNDAGNDGDTSDADPYYSRINPYCVRRADGSPPPPLPQYAVDFFFSDEVEDNLHRILMAGAVSNSNVATFLKWLWCNNYTHHRYIVKAVVEHTVEDLWPDSCIAVELPYLLDVFTMDDDLKMERYRDLLLGVNSDGQGALEGILDACRTRNVKLTQMPTTMLYIRMACAMYEAQPELWKEVIDRDSPGRYSDWAADSLYFAQDFHRKLNQNSRLAQRWENLSAECPESEKYYDVDDIIDILSSFSGEYSYDQGFDDNDDYDAAAEGTGGTSGGGGYGHFFGLLPAGSQQQQQQHQFNFSPTPPSAVVAPPGSPVEGPPVADIPARGGGNDEDDEVVAEIELGDSEEENKGG